MRALVVDDSRAMRLIITRVLQEMGMETLDAGDGRQALERLRDNPDVQLVLVDWNMPVMNGLEFVQAVRAQPVYRRLRLVMVTSETEIEQVTRALEAGASEYVMKPFTKDVLVAKLNMLDLFEE